MEGYISWFTIIFFIYDKENKKLIWNIGKLKKDEEIIINYFVKITSGKPKDIIESIGFVNYLISLNRGETRKKRTGTQNLNCLENQGDTSILKLI